MSEVRFDNLKDTFVTKIVCEKPINRRAFLRGSLKAATVVGFAAGASSTALASAVTGLPEKQVSSEHESDKRLRLVNAHTWEKLDVVYWSQGKYLLEGLQKINYLMRDHRANAAIQMDVNLIDDLYTLYQGIDTDERIQILSGYRTKATNAKLRQRSNGVAKYSLHMEGRAVDISIPGTKASRIREVAMSMKAGGVGYYKSSGFVHMDTGNVRSWGQG